MVLGNIIYDGKMPYSYDFIKTYKYSERVGIDNSIPTLYIGYSETKNALGPFNPLNKTIDEKTMWTYTPMEKARDFQEDLFNFTIDCCKTFISDYTYYFVSLYNKIERDNYLKLIKGNIKEAKFLFTKKDTLYVVIKKDIFAFSYKEMQFIGLDCRRILNHIKTRFGNVFTEKDISQEGVVLSLLLDDERWLSLFI